ncbi:hypothetical protein PV327_004829, partial [Microctonus hyperodae]
MRYEQSTTVAGFRRRHHLVEEVPGLSIRRLTLEDPRIVRERDRNGSRSPSPVRHICHPRSGQARPGRGSSRFWLDRMNKERPAYLTITSLELPDSPIPLIDSQASARLRPNETSSHVNSQRDEISNEFIDVTKEKERNKMRHSARNNKIKKNNCIIKQCTNNKECKITQSIINCKRNNEPMSRNVIQNANDGATKDCICSEITENLRINIREKTEVNQSSRSPSPEVTHTIRIAMKYLGQVVRDDDSVVVTSPTIPSTTLDNNNFNSTEVISANLIDNERPTINNKNEEFNCCAGVNVALDFTLNCNNLQVTTREINLKPVSKNNIQ